MSQRKFLPAELWAWVEGWMGLPERAETAQIKASFLAASSPTCPSRFISTAARRRAWRSFSSFHGPLVSIRAGLRRCCSRPPLPLPLQDHSALLAATISEAELCAGV